MKDKNLILWICRIVLIIGLIILLLHSTHLIYMPDVFIGIVKFMILCTAVVVGYFIWKK